MEAIANREELEKRREEKKVEVYPWWENIKRLRKERNMTARTLCGLTGLPSSTLSRIEKEGVLFLEISNLYKICDALSVTPNDIFLGQNWQKSEL